MKKLEFPINRCTIDITEKCNLRCGYCFTYGIGKRDLTYNKGVEIVDWLFKDEISQSNTIDISWWGGEPFLKFELMKQLTDYALSIASKQGKTVSFNGTSNTTLMTKEVVDWMKQYNSYFLMSIDGIGNIQNKNRPLATGGSSWNKIAKNLPYITQEIPFINSRMSNTTEHVDKFFDTFKQLYEKYNIKTQMYSPVFEMDWTDEKLNIAQEQLMLLCDYIVELRLKGEDLKVKHLDDGVKALHFKKSKPEFPCGAGRFYVGISVDGVIYPCHRFNKYDGKNWKQKGYIGTIQDGITDPKFRYGFTNFMDFPVPEKCSNCELYGNLCDRSCYAINYDLSRSIFTSPDVYCRWQKMHSKVVHYFYKKIKENNLRIEGNFNMSGNSCICNNMCYMENTPTEIKKIDPTTDATCICNNTGYSGDKSENIARRLTEVERSKFQQNPPMQVSREGSNLLMRLNEQLNDVKVTNDRLAKAIELLTEVLKSKVN